ncbi:MAG TPA: hypothetical protein VJ001_02190 [Rhodocyclaceae bacterium]|nr:hypothetical protein [Rhodocyclaceae bacterium]
MNDENLIRIHSRLDDIQKLLTRIEVSQGVSASFQERTEREIDMLKDNFEIGRKYIAAYQGDRKFVLGIIAAVTVIMGALNGIAVKVASSYIADIEARIDKNEAKSRERYEQALFDSTKNSTDIDNLRNKILELHGGKPLP